MNDVTNVMYITKEGLDKLIIELKGLKEIKRGEIAKKIKIAREMGDISENAMYDSAREEQRVVESRIAELENIIKTSKVADTKITGEVSVGSKVTVHIEGEDETFHIVGAPEADPMKRKISHESPIGAALLGKKKGDEVSVEAPMGVLTYKVLSID